MFSTEEIAATDRLLTTTKAVRKRLDLHRPVPREVVEECLRVALHAPNAGNAQRWRWILVDDPDVRGPLADLYSRALMNRMGGGDRSGSSGDIDNTTSSILHLAEHMHEVPVLVVPCTLDRWSPKIDLTGSSTLFSSVLPAAWSLMLALHSRGLGSCWTTVHLDHADEAAELLGLPPRATQVGLVPVAWTTADAGGPSDREPLSQVAAWNRWPEPAPEA